jgi:hypothetical protein
MSSDLLTNIKELLIFYVKTNYESYLQEKKITSIPESEVSQVVRQIYNQRKDHSKVFVKDSLKQVLKTEYPGDSQIELLLRDIYEDDRVMVQKMTNQIVLYQQSKNQE